MARNSLSSLPLQAFKKVHWSANGSPVARDRPPWLSLDEGDNEHKRFLTYLVAALQTLDLSELEGLPANLGNGVLGALQSPQLPPTESILTALLNESTTLLVRITLVLNDYHIIDVMPVNDALTFLLEHQPRQVGW